MESGKLTMHVHDKAKIFKVHNALNLPTICEELSTINMIDITSERTRISPRNPFKRALICEEIYGDAAPDLGCC